MLVDVALLLAVVACRLLQQLRRVVDQWSIPQVIFAALVAFPNPATAVEHVASRKFSSEECFRPEMCNNELRLMNINRIKILLNTTTQLQYKKEKKNKEGEELPTITR